MEALDKLHTTAESHARVMILEVMGRDTGWIALHAGMSGGADIILIPEIPFLVEQVVADVEARTRRGRDFSLIVVAEGASPKHGHAFYVSSPSGDVAAPARLGGVGNWLAAQLDGRVNHEVRATVLGHLQRGGSPTARDRMLGSRFGVRAVELIESGQLGHMVALHDDQIVAVPLVDAVARIKRVAPDGELVRAARALGITFGDQQLAD
jgi:6-phosphofructokinase 1